MDGSTTRIKIKSTLLHFYSSIVNVSQKKKSYIFNNIYIKIKINYILACQFHFLKPHQDGNQIPRKEPRITFQFIITKFN